MTGGWFVSNCQGEFAATEAGAANPRAFFFGGSGFNGRNVCAPTRAAQLNNTSTTTVVLIRISGFMTSLLSFSSAEEFSECGSGSREPSGEQSPPRLKSDYLQFLKNGVALSTRESPDNQYQEKSLRRFNPWICADSQPVTLNQISTAGFRRSRNFMSWVGRINSFIRVRKAATRIKRFSCDVLKCRIHVILTLTNIVHN